MAAAWVLAAGGGWVAAVNNPPPRAVVREVLHAVHGLFAGLFWTNPLPSGAVNPVHALIAGCIAGLGQGLPIGTLGQSFAWAYLLRWSGAPLSDQAAALRCACLLGAALGLGALLRAEWSAVWSTLHGRGAAPDRGNATSASAAGPLPAPEADVVLLAAVPAFILRWLLRHLTGQLEAAATVGIFLLLSAQVLRRAQGWVRGATETSAAVPPWIAVLAGVGGGLGALPGVSGLAVFLAIALYGRTAPQAAVRFALMVATVVSALLGLAAIPGAVAALIPGIVPAAAGAAAGAYAGGLLLRRWLGRTEDRAMPALASYCEAVGGLMLLFGVFAI